MVRIRPIREAGCAELSDHSLSGYSLRANLIEEMPLIRPGHAVFAIRKCLVRMRRSSSQRRIPVFNVETPVTAGDVVSGRLTVLLKSYAFARIKLSEMVRRNGFRRIQALPRSHNEVVCSATSLWQRVPID